jgi:hypothetical protein
MWIGIVFMLILILIWIGINIGIRIRIRIGIKTMLTYNTASGRVPDPVQIVRFGSQNQDRTRRVID